LGLAVEPVATQVVARDRHAELVCALAVLSASVEQFALEIRHLQRTEVAEAFEPFGRGQKGSSAMPHKRNPILCERICGLARILRGHAVAALENVALWHERDISHSSVERVILPDTTITVDYMLELTRRLIEGLVVFPERMRENLMVGEGLVFSQAVLTALIEAGMTREEAYGIVQAAAARAWDEGASFRETIEADPVVTERLDPGALAAAFEPKLEHLDAVFDRLEKLEVPT
jgi:adenylosuccinate lyase